MSTATIDLGGGRGSTSTVARTLAWRSIALIPRSPSTFVPSLIFPVFSVVAFSGAFSAVAKIPHFPTRTMLDFVLPFTIAQGSAFAGMTTGFGVARDMEGGFFDRLLLAPVRPVALVLGPLGAAVVRAVLPFTLVTIIGLLGGAHLQGGALGLLTLLIASLGLALIAAGWSVGLALRFGSMKVAPLVQVGLFVAMFLSTAQVPLFVMTGWLHGVARLNPMTSVLQLARQGFEHRVTWADSWPGLLVLAVGSVSFTLFALRGLRKVKP